MRGRKSFLLLEILVNNFNGIKRSRKHRRNRVTWINKRICRCCASHFQDCYDTINNFGKLGIKENLAGKLKQIGQIEVTPDCEEVLRTKICWKFFRKVTVLANGVKKSTTASIINFCSAFNLKSLSFPALGKGESNASLNNEAIF